MAGPSSAAIEKRSTESLSSDDLSISDASTAPSTVNDADVLTAINLANILNAAPASIPLSRGNAISDIPVPAALLASLSSSSSSSANNHSETPNQRTEFSHIRYSALTCRPTDFVRSGFTLRQELYTRPRPTGILVSMLVRGESVEDVHRSLSAVRNAVKALCARQEKPWGPGAWKKIMLVVVCDGEPRLETLALFGALGVWTEQLFVSLVRGKEVRGHLFEYTTPLHLGRDRKGDGAFRVRRSSVPLQMALCSFDQVSTVEAQQWILTGFGELLAPRVWVPIKVGDAPPPEYFYDAWAVENQIDRGRNYHSYYGENGRDTGAEAQDPESGPGNFILDEVSADDRYNGYLTTLDRYMRSQHRSTTKLSSGGGGDSRSSARGQARNFFRSLVNR